MVGFQDTSNARREAVQKKPGDFQMDPFMDNQTYLGYSGLQNLGVFLQPIRRPGSSYPAFKAVA